MNALELTIKMAELAEQGTEPLKAFTTCTKAGMTGVKRDAFEGIYATMAEPFPRKLAVRQARESAFLDQLMAACRLADPPELECNKLAAALGAAKQNPAMVPNCLAAFEPYLTPETLESLRAGVAELWP